MSLLAVAFERLNEQQRRAVTQDGHTVVLAGPGSGKTDTLAVRVGVALDALPGPQRIGCLTYSNDAVREFSTRLRSFGIPSRTRLFTGTVHSFCLTQVIRPYAALAGRPDLLTRRVLSTGEKLVLIQRSLDAHAINEQARFADTTLTTIRRAIACGSSLQGFDDRYIAVARVYEEELAAAGVIDFEGMVLEALAIVRSDEDVRDLLVSRYPQFVVDEYQDMGGPLHLLMLALRDAGATIFAVGDPDQCIYAFTGADPTYLTQLATELRVDPIRLQFNYRAGASLVAAAERMLEAPRGYQPAPDRADAGEIVFQDAEPGFDAQADLIVSEVVPTLLASGVAPHDIVILYRGRGPLLDELERALANSQIPYVIERDARFPDAPVVKWLQRCAAAALEPEHEMSESFDELVSPYLSALREGGRFDEDELVYEGRFVTALDRAVDADTPISQWISQLDDSLDLRNVLRAEGSQPDDIEAIESLRANQADVTVAAFAKAGSSHGKVAVTTYHGSKGRQFRAVILPGLQRTVLPSERWNARRREYEISDRQLEEERRLFYVGVTRARETLVLVSSPYFRNGGGFKVEGRSRFIDELVGRLFDTASNRRTL